MPTCATHHTISISVRLSLFAFPTLVNNTPIYDSLHCVFKSPVEAKNILSFTSGNKQSYYSIRIFCICWMLDKISWVAVFRWSGENRGCSQFPQSNCVDNNPGHVVHEVTQSTGKNLCAEWRRDDGVCESENNFPRDQWINLEYIVVQWASISIYHYVL